MPRKIAVGLTTAALALSGLALAAAPAGAATFDVTSGADDGSVGTFRWAVAQAGLSAGDDTVTIAPSAAAITLTDCVAGRVAIAPSGLLTIKGNGATVTQTCDGDGVLGGVGDTTIEDLTITGGDSVDEGAGIRLNGGLTLDGVTVSGNVTDSDGGGIFGNSITLIDSTVTDNRAGGEGGGVFAITAGGTFTATGSTISANTAGGYGGGAFSEGTLSLTDTSVVGNSAVDAGGTASIGATTIDESEVSDNVASGSSGGVFALATLTITDSLVSGNTAGSFAGGAISTGAMTVTGSTVSGNTAVSGAGLAAQGPITVDGSAIIDNAATAEGGGITGTTTVTVRRSTVSNNTAALGAGVIGIVSVDLSYATIVANNGAANVYAPAALSSFGSVVALGGGGDCSLDGTGVVTSGGYNFSGDSTCGFTLGTDTSNGGNPALSTIGGHDGTTVNHVPLSASPLLNKIPADDVRCAGTDQRAFARPQNGTCDIGSVEVRQVSAVSTAVETPYQTPVTVDLATLITDPDQILNPYTAEGAFFGELSAVGPLVTYAPDAGFSGPDSYTFEVCSDNAAICTSVQTVSITVGPGPTAAPAAVVVNPTFTG